MHIATMIRCSHNSRTLIRLGIHMPSLSIHSTVRQNYHFVPGLSLPRPKRSNDALNTRKHCQQYVDGVRQSVLGIVKGLEYACKADNQAHVCDDACASTNSRYMFRGSHGRTASV